VTAPTPTPAPAVDRAPTVVVVDDKLALAETLADGLSDHGFAATALASGREALARVTAGGVDVLVTDLRMPDLDGLALLEAARAVQPELPVIVMTAYGAIDSAVESIRRGAFHYLTKPFKLDELLVFIGRAVSDRALRVEAHALRTALRGRAAIGVGDSPQMQRVAAIVERVGAADASVLITGETGTGKGVVARAIHAAGPRAAHELVTVNCAALPDQLLESELFGHVRGAFTGATADAPGLFALAHQGTLLLDEIGEMSPQLQAKLLHVLESGTVRPLGAGKERTVDVRVLAATHRDLRARVAEGTFREDLLYRLDVVTIELPPLRHRAGDIPALLAHFVDEARRKYPTSAVTGFARDALARLVDYRWPGNVRELAHVVERAVLLAEGPLVGEGDLPPPIRDAPRADAPFSGDVEPIRELTKRYARWAFARLGGHKNRTAEALGVDVKTLNRWLEPE
jgi:two-component system response regulator HydG